MTENRIRDQCINEIWKQGAAALTTFPCNMFCVENPGTCMANVFARQKAITQNSGSPCKTCGCFRDDILKQYEIGEGRTPSETAEMKQSMMNELDALCKEKPIVKEGMYSRYLLGTRKWQLCSALLVIFTILYISAIRNS